MRKIRLDGEKIKECRDGRDHAATQKEFAHEIGISDRQLRKIENTNAPVTAETADRIARALKKPIEELSLKHEHAPAAAAAEVTKHQGSTAADDLIALGPDIIFTGELVHVEQTEWTMRAKEFVAGDLNDLITYIDRFSASPPGNRYMLVNTLGDGRLLSDAPALTRSGSEQVIQCPVAASFGRRPAERLGSQMALSPETGDLFAENGQIARVSGLDSLPQKVRTCLSLHRGERPFHPDAGARLAEFFHRFRDTPWLLGVLKLELIRQAAIPYRDPISGRSDTPLQCVERVKGIELLAPAPEDGRLPIRVYFDVAGVGRWEQEISISLPSSATLETIQNRQKAFSVLHSGGAVTGEALNSMLSASGQPAKIR